MRKEETVCERERERALELVLSPKMMMSSYVKLPETRFILVFISGSEWRPATITFSLLLLLVCVCVCVAGKSFIRAILSSHSSAFASSIRDLVVRRQEKNTRPSPSYARTR